jgi:hypothetical protein
MAMGMSSKFGRMKLKSSDTTKPPASVKKPQMRGGVASRNAVMDRRSASPASRVRSARSVVAPPTGGGPGGVIQRIMPNAPAKVNAEKRRARMEAMKKRMGSRG